MPDLKNPKVIAGVTVAVLALATPVVLHFEGTRLIPYRDPIGIVTVCTGHTKSARLGEFKTAAECRALLQTDFQEHWNGMQACVKRPLPDEVAAAMLSATFNIGVGAFCGSTILRKLNAGDLAGACVELSRWTMADGQVLPGLVRRRAEERKLCESGLRPLSLGVRG